MLKTEYLVAKIGVDRAEIELSEVCRSKHAIPTLTVINAALHLLVELLGGLLVALLEAVPHAPRLDPSDPSHSRKLSRERSQLYRRRFLQMNTHFAALLEIYRVI